MPDRPLRVLYVNPYGIYGGAAKSLLRLVESLDRTQVEAHVAAPDGGDFAAEVRELSLRFHPVPTCRLRAVYTPWGLARMAWRFCGFCRHLKRICRAVQPDLVHANNLTTALAATRVSRAPAIWHVRDMPVRRRLVRAVRSRVARVIAISRAVAANVEAVAPGGAPVVTIYNGWNHRDVHVTRRRSQVRGHWEMAPDTPLVGCMAQFVPWKRHDLVLQALPLILPQVPQARLVLLGEDLFGEHTEYLASLHALAAELGIEDRIIWGGCVPDPANALAALDVVAHAADREPFGRVVLEAIALGIPVVAVDAAGPAEIIEDGRSGLLVPPDDPAALAEGVTRVLGDAELAQSLSDGARIRAAAFTASVAAEEVVALYREVMAEREAN